MDGSVAQTDFRTHPDPAQGWDRSRAAAPTNTIRLPKGLSPPAALLRLWLAYGK